VAKSQFRYYHLYLDSTSTPHVNLSLQSGSAYLVIGLGFVPTLDSFSFKDDSNHAVKEWRLCGSFDNAWKQFLMFDKSKRNHTIAYIAIYGDSNATFDIVGSDNYYYMSEGIPVNETLPYNHNFLIAFPASGITELMSLVEFLE